MRIFLPNRVLMDGRLGFVLFFFNSADKVAHSQITREDQYNYESIRKRIIFFLGEGRGIINNKDNECRNSQIAPSCHNKC